MNLSTLASLTLAACQAPASAAPSDPSQTEVRAYDLSSLVLTTSSSGCGDSVWPVLTYDEGETGWDMELYEDEEAPATLVRILFARDFELESNSIDYQGQGLFTVRAPTSLHDRIAKVLPAVAEVFAAELELELLFVRLGEPGFQGAALVPEAQANALVESAAKEGRVSRRRFSLASGRPETFSQGTWVDVLTEYDVEVAQGSFVFDPQPWRAYLGTRIAVRAAPGLRGTHLALNLRRARATGEISERLLTRTSRIANEQQSGTESASILHQRLPILDQGLGLNTFLPEGQVLAIASSQGSSGLGELLLVRRINGGLARTARLGSGTDGVLLVDMTAWAPPYTTSSWDDLGLQQRPRDPYLEGPSMWIGLCAPRERGVDVADLLYNRIYNGQTIENVEEFGPWLALAPQGDAPLPDIEAELGDLAPDQRLVQVALTLRTPDSKAPVASLSLPLRAGLASSALLGVEDTYIGNVDVEVAQYASVEDPIVSALFDGLMLELEPRFALDGSLSLRLRGHASARDGDPVKHQLARGSIGEVETASQSFLMIAETLRFPAGEKSARAVIGDLADGLSLEVEVRF